MLYRSKKKSWIEEELSNSLTQFELGLIDKDKTLFKLDMLLRECSYLDRGEKRQTRNNIYKKKKSIEKSPLS